MSRSKLGEGGRDGGRDEQWRLLGDIARVQWDRKAPANQYLGNAYATTVHPPDDNWSSIQASRYGQQPSRTLPSSTLRFPAAQQDASPKLRGRSWDKMNPVIPGDHSPMRQSDFNLSQPMGTSPMVGFGMNTTPAGGVWARPSPQDTKTTPRALRPSASEPLYHVLPEGRTRDGNLIERHATDIHEGRPWRKNVPWAPRSDYDAESARDDGNRSDLGTQEKAVISDGFVPDGASRHATDIHDGKPWRRAVPWAPDENYGVGDPHPQPPHMRSEVDSVVYGRDIDGSGSGGEVPEWATHLGLSADNIIQMGWSMKRRSSNIHWEYKGEPAATSSLHKPVGQEQAAGRRMQQIVFGSETEGTHHRDSTVHYGKQQQESQDAHGLPTSFKPPERTGGMAEVMANPYLSASYDTASRASHERGQSDVLSAESNPYFRRETGGRHGKLAAYEQHFAVPGSQVNQMAVASQKDHGHRPHPELFRAGLTSDQAAVECIRPLPDAKLLWRHQLVESDIQHYRNPDGMTVKRRAHYDQAEDDHFVERARESGFAPRTLAERKDVYPTGTFNRRASELHPSEVDEIHPGAWDKSFHDHRDRLKPVQYHGRKKLGALRPMID